MAGEKFYLTTPIYYVNDKPQIGNAYTTFAADTLARFKRFTGSDVLFTTGTDEHGQKAAQAAKERGLSPQVHVDEMAKEWEEIWKSLNISYDDFIRTTQERHKKVVNFLFEKLYKKGDIYKGEYAGWYCTYDETFWLQSQLKEGKCPNPWCQREVLWIKEESYFFKLSRYQEPLLKHLKENPQFVRPEVRYNEVISFIKSGLEDVCVSRKSFEWGIPVPFDQKHTVYVWIDALINYLTLSGYLQDEEKFKKFWPADLHIIGKDILRFHAVIWPAMLMAAEIPLPRCIFAHGFWNVEGEKMSKSKGNVVRPISLVKELSKELGIGEDLTIDVVKYFLLREAPFGLDGNFSKTALFLRFNADLANDLGNLFHRSLPMVKKYCQGKIPQPEGETNSEIKAIILESAQKIGEFMDNLEFSLALSEVWKVVSYINKYIDKSAPWRLAREGKKEELDQIIYNLGEALTKVCLLVSPFMPTFASMAWEQLGIKEDLRRESWERVKEWGFLSPGTQVKPGKPIFPRRTEDRGQKN